MTEAADQMVKDTEFDKNTTTSDQANNIQALHPLKKWIAVPMPPGMTEEIRQARIKRYWRDKKLAEETAKNTELNKNITISDQANHRSASPPSNMKQHTSTPPRMTEEAQQAGNRQHWGGKSIRCMSTSFLYR
jgi:hypothetical protein